MKLHQQLSGEAQIGSIVHYNLLNFHSVIRSVWGSEIQFKETLCKINVFKKYYH